ncbi:LANO_0H20978g1_1 [Lachancea nothofagi CBS 11611]|uniref:Serine/threonine-protein phosphatase n=1 Tax=Lachancea nothofagi CBS 11611 TaxID=1266666 RepID=A0A1G4KNJ6_9SACH|nr:LANO_0H20978g1_1 [Lachancea nothofagi CBS 11611]
MAANEEARQHALVFKNEGNAFIKEKKYTEAVERYSKAIELDDTQSIYFSNRAFARLKLDNFLTAVEDCDKAINLDPKNIKALHRRGLSHVGLLNFSLARKDFKKLLLLKPKEPTAVKALEACEKFIRQEKFNKAISGDGDEIKVNLCAKVQLSSFDGNADILNYQGHQLDISQLTNERQEPTGALITNMSQEFISYMVNDLFLKGKNLPKKYVAAIVSHAERLFHQEPPVVELSNDSETDVKISVCGDTHGQFYDVLNIFKTFGKVGSKHSYLFNGDFVDRGSWSCEVALLYYCLKILFPNNMFINRGNHETDNMNKIYGFEDECKYKYSPRIFEMFSQSFEALPLATVINEKYLVMHGGLSADQSVTLDDIKKIDRFSQPPRDGPFMELLWSDPQASNGLGPSERGLGHSFGPDITASFLAKNKLSKIFRSHEVRMGGILFEHEKKLATVFSAPNYCDSQGNLGGIIHVVPGMGIIGQNGNDDEDLIVETFEAVKHPEIKPMAYSNGGLGF